MSELRPYQQQELDFHLEHPFSANWSEPGLGKTRVLLRAAESPTVVVAPAAVRDTRVWPREAERIGVEPPTVISYHEVARMGPLPDIPLRTLILDESQHAKDNKTTWFPGLEYMASRAQRMHQATGTPYPNAPHEVWAQFHLMYQDEYAFRYKWPWMETWFILTKNRYNPDARDISSNLANCNHKGAEAEQCAHWQEFYEANIEGRAIRHLRDDVLKDLPPLSGADHALDTPMTPLQARAYKAMKKSLMAIIPEEGIAIEALSKTEQFSMLHRLSSGLSILDPEADPKDKHSGKLAEFAELLSERKRPTLVTPWFRMSAAALARQCTRLGKSYVMMGSKTTRLQRDQAVQRFSQGDYDVMIASIGVVKEGVDGLQRGADEAILFERSWRPGDNEQTIRRLHRLGQVYPVTIRQLVTPSSVDSYQWDVIHAKEKIIGRALRRVELASLI